MRTKTKGPGPPAQKPVLTIGTAVALLATHVPADRDGHIRLATQLLRTATGDAGLQLSRRPSGRPRLEPPWPELAISLSYRDGLLLVGFDPTQAVGVDVEPATLAGVADPAQLARDHFSQGEAAALAAASVAASRDLFLRLWVAKEAALKLTGRGIYDGLCEPDLAGALADLQQDGTPIRLPRTSRLPALELAVAHVAHADIPDGVYCALARTLPTA